MPLRSFRAATTQVAAIYIGGDTSIIVLSPKFVLEHWGRVPITI